MLTHNPVDRARQPDDRLLPPELIGLLELIAQCIGAEVFAQVGDALLQGMKSRAPHPREVHAFVASGSPWTGPSPWGDLGWDSSSPPGLQIISRIMLL